MSSIIRPKDFKERVFFRDIRAQVDGNAKVEYGLTQIKGVGRRFAQALVRASNINPELRIGELSEKNLQLLEHIIMNPNDYLPFYLFNRCKDLRTGEDLHLIGNKLEITVKTDIDRMKRIKSYKGVRHHLHLKVRGQKTKSTGRHGLVVGVMRRRKRYQTKRL